MATKNIKLSDKIPAKMLLKAGARLGPGFQKQINRGRDFKNKLTGAGISKTN